MDARARKLLDEGREKFLARDFHNAEQILTDLLPDVKGFADVHNMLGVVFHNQGKFGKALEFVLGHAANVVSDNKVKLLSH